MRVAILESDLQIAEPVSLAFRDSGHHCHNFRRSDAMLMRLKRDTFDLCLLAVSGVGAAVTPVMRLKHSHPRLPLMVVSDAKSESAVIETLSAGADDYLCYTSDRLLIARAEALTRFARLTYSDSVEATDFDDYTFDPAGFQVRMADGSSVALTPKEFALALVLFRNLSREVSRDYLIETVWGRRAEIASRTLDTHTSRLRSKLRLFPERGYLLSAVYSQGYRLDRLPDDHALSRQSHAALRQNGMLVPMPAVGAQQSVKFAAEHCAPGMR